MDEAGNGVVFEPRLYQLVRQLPQIRERRFELAAFVAFARAHAGRD